MSHATDKAGCLSRNSVRVFTFDFEQKYYCAINTVRTGCTLWPPHHEEIDMNVFVRAI